MDNFINHDISRIPIKKKSVFQWTCIWHLVCFSWPWQHPTVIFSWSSRHLGTFGLGWQLQVTWSTNLDSLRWRSWFVQKSVYSNHLLDVHIKQLVVQPAINFLAPEKMKGLEVGSDGFGQVLGGIYGQVLRGVDSLYWRIFFQADFLTWHRTMN